MVWSDIMGWDMPRIHVDVTRWLDMWTTRVKVLKMARGFAKSTIVGTNVAHDVYQDPGEAHILAQGADNKVASKMSRHARHVVARHPLCTGLYNRENWGVQQWSVLGNKSERDPSCSSAGAMSNVTASRATKAIFDDVEVPKNIKTAESRELLRLRLSEATHVLVPGGKKLYIGTPHTVDSIYEEQAAAGADVLEYKLFQYHKRYENETRKRVFPITFKPRFKDDLYVFNNKLLLVDGRDFEYRQGAIHFKKSPAGVVDIYAGNNWPERFDRAEIQFRRKECKTLNEWDSQYQLHAKPIHDIRLDPDKLIGYSVEPKIEYVNREVVLRLGDVRIVAATTWWDVAIGKIRGDASALCSVFQDESGRYYWHVAKGLTGDLDNQCEQVKETLVALQLEHCWVEVNGVGGFVPAVLRKHLAGTGCSVSEEVTKTNKDKDILDGLEGPLSAGVMWAHESLWQTPAIEQMRDWIPGVPNQADDYIDGAAKAILKAPVRIGKIVGSVVQVERAKWRPDGGTHEAIFER